MGGPGPPVVVAYLVHGMRRGSVIVELVAANIVGHVRINAGSYGPGVTLGFL